MKKYLNKLFLPIIIGIVLMSSCTKQETEIYYVGGTAPVLTANVKDTIALIPADSLSSAVAFTWTNPKYTFSNGISSQNVTYNLQIDTLGSNFTNPLIQTISTNSALGNSITVKELNTILASKAKLSLAFAQPHTIQVRVISQLGSNQAQLKSNILNFIVTPYPPPPAVTLPSTGTLFIVGSAVAGGWSNPIAADKIAAQQFTQISLTEYKITIALIGGNEYKLIAKSGSWTEQYSVAKADDPAMIYGGKFVGAINNPQNALAPSEDGIYVIDVNFQSGLFTVTKQ